MINISDKTEIIGLEQTGCTVEHIDHCLHDENLHGKPKYKFLGRIIEKGEIVVHTKTGDWLLYYDAEHNWARKILIKGKV